MEKEKLSIALKKVTVEYEFLNESDSDITSEVAFPVPAYEYRFDHTGGPREFSDFRLWVNGEPIKYSTQAKAVVKGKDFAPLLRRLHVNFVQFGHFDYEDEKLAKYDVAKLAKRDRDELIRLGLVAADDMKPLWTVEKTYYWTQTFPAHIPLRVRHEYSPLWGWMDTSLSDFDLYQKAASIGQLAVKEKQFDSQNPFDGICFDLPLRHKVEEDEKKWALKVKDGPSDFFILIWVDYILSTANNWKKPIKEFELVVERPTSYLSKKWYVAFCWDGQTERPDADHFVVRARDFVPLKELRVAFVGMDIPPENSEHNPN